MKKYIHIILISAMILIVAGCSKKNDKTAAGTPDNGGTTVTDVLNAGIAADEALYDPTPAVEPVLSQAADDESIVETETKAMTHDGIDVDLTVLSSTMVYAEVYNMMVAPSDYVGKVVKMNGTYNTYYDESTGRRYFFCIIQDATACCSQGMEFVLTDDRSYPDDYPQEGSEVTVTGIFETYMEGEDMYCNLVDAKII